MKLLTILESLSTNPPEEIREYMEEHYGVNVKHEVSEKSGQELFLFKYGQISADWTKEETHECRGVILSRHDGKWGIVSRPFDKFFNLHEGYCPLFDNKEWEAQRESCYLIEKVDGTCIQVWWDDLTEFRASTLGTISTKEISGKTFEEWFWEVSEIGFSSLRGFTLKEQEEYTFIFELCMPENQVVTRYERPVVMLTGIRNFRTGEYINIFDCKGVDHLLEGSRNIRLPYRYSMKEEGIKTKDDLWVWIERHAKDPKYGEIPEGFVIYSQEGKPLAKCKNAKYLMHHRFTGDFRHSQASIIEASMKGEIDDYYNGFSDSLRNYSDRLHAYISEKLKQWKYEIHSLEGTYESRKEYALKVKEVISDPRLFGFCFENLERIQHGEESISERLEGWLSQNYKKFEQEWKEL